MISTSFPRCVTPLKHSIKPRCYDSFIQSLGISTFELTRQLSIHPVLNRSSPLNQSFAVHRHQTLKQTRCFSSLNQPSQSNSRFVWDSALPVSQASTLPASFYNDPSVLEIEKSSVFSDEWLYVGRVDEVAESGQFFTGEFLGEPYVIVRDSTKQASNQTTDPIRGFFNVCCHHAMPVAKGRGTCDEFVCGYHGWRYALNGRLKRAVKMNGIENFKASAVSLNEFPVKVVGSFIFAHFDFHKRRNGTFDKETVSAPSTAGLDLMHQVLSPFAYESMRYVKTLTYSLNCNWKVFCDNYLDGGLHVQYAHPSLNDEIDMTGYTIESFDRCSVQSAEAKSSLDPATDVIEKITASLAQKTPRVHGQAKYVFVYPNLMINRYGHWMDTNHVIPLTQTTCRVVIDYFLDEKGINNLDDVAIETSLKASDQVQQEDVELCQLVQKGLGSVGYGRSGGRYSPKVEFAMHDFHRQYYQQVKQFLPT